MDISTKCYLCFLNHWVSPFWWRRKVRKDLGNIFAGVGKQYDGDMVLHGELPILMELFVALFRYLPDGFLRWMLLGGGVGDFISSAHS